MVYPRRLTTCTRLEDAMRHALLAVGTVFGVVAGLAAPAVPVEARPVAAPPVTAEVEQSRPTEATALAAARSSGRQVEVTALRSETREVYAQPDGSFTAVEHLRPVRTRQGGTWTPVDTTLRRQPDGSVAPVAATVDLAFSGGGTAPMVRLGKAGRQLSLTWPGTLPVPLLSGDTATYAEVLPGVDLQLRAEPDGMAQTLVVKNAAAAANPALEAISFGVATTGLRVEVAAGGGLRATDTAGGGVVFAAPTPVMWDSAPDAGGGAGSRMANLGVDVAADRLTLRPDRTLLTGAGTRYPVYIDPAWRTEKGSAWAMVSSGFPTTSYYKFNGKSTEGVGLCEVSKDASCVKNQIKRLFYRIPASHFAGKTILSATFTGYETFAYNCNNPTVVQLWLTKAFGSSSTWNSTDDNWLERLDSRDVAYCSSTPVEFNAKAAVVQAAAGNWSTITFGLRAYSESSMGWWKRFADDAYLRVNYNSPPAQPKMAQLSMSPGGTCVGPATPHWVRSHPTVSAKGLTDPDGDKVYAQIRVAWEGGEWLSATIGPKASGPDNVFSLTLPNTLPQNIVLAWGARVWDGTAWGPWSYAGSAATGCYFIVDSSVPSGPMITSADGRYPPSNPADESDPWHDGVGKYGKFTLDSAATDVTRYRYGIGTSPSAANEVATSGGAARTIDIVPTRSGLFFITAQAFDAAGNASQIETYYFRVAAGTPERAHWKLDEPAGSVTLTDTSAAGAAPATVSGSVSLGVAGVAGSAMQVSGTGYASTASAVLDTTRSFAVSAWARLSSKASTPVVVSQEGTVGSSFALYYSPSYDRWIFNMQPPDSANPTLIRAIAPTSPALHEWTHLVGVYDATAKQISLYVNGRLAQTTAQPNVWAANGPLNIGRFKYKGGYSAGHNFTGTIDDLRVFDRLVTGDEVADLFTAHPVVKARWRLNTGTTTTPDDTRLAHTATLANQAVIGPGIVGAGALVLGGGAGYAATAGPVLATNESFTVAAWVSAAGRPATNAAVISQHGAVTSGFTVRYAPDAAGGAGGYQFEMPDQDTSTATPQTVDHSSFQASLEWDHVAVVYDAFADEMRLYVNGQLEQLADGSRQSYRSNALGFNATGSLQLGRAFKSGIWGEYWTGSIDDVWAFSGVLTGEQIQMLAGAGDELPTETFGGVS